MKNLYTKILGSFDKSSGGFAARKLSAFAFMLLVTFIHYKYVDKSNAIDALIVDSCMILLLLGLVTFEQVIALRNGDKKSPE